MKLENSIYKHANRRQRGISIEAEILHDFGKQRYSDGNGECQGISAG